MNREIMDTHQGRYHRQLILEGFGMEAQRKLLGARVLVIGAGGLGCPVMVVLAGAGVGRIGVVDDGVVELSNLHRQPIYATRDVGRPKVACAQRALQALNPEVTVDAHAARMSVGNTLAMLEDYDVIVDGTDNFQTKYMINDACALLGKPLVYGAVSRYAGQVAVFRDGVSYRDVFPDPPREADVPNCSEAGVLGVLPGIIGHFMANECIKLLIGQETLAGKLLTYDASDNRMLTVEVSPTASGAARIPSSRAAFEATDYPALCGAAGPGTDGAIGVGDFRQLLADDGVEVVDVREYGEMPHLEGIASRRIPLASLPGTMASIAADTVVFVCKSGKRSIRAAELYREAHPDAAKRAYSLAGGIDALEKDGWTIG